MTVYLKHKEQDFEVTDKDQKRSRQTVVMYYQITVRRTSIRRVIVDPVVNDINGNDRIRVHFELNCPVLIRRAFRTDKQEADHRHAIPHYRRHLVINRGRSANQYPTAKAITDSPVFTIEFDSSVSISEVYRLLSRLRVRTGVSIEFADIPSVDCLIWRENPYHRWTFQNGQHLPATHFSAPIYREFITTAFPRKHEVCGSREIDINRELKFAITYLLECLISRLFFSDIENGQFGINESIMSGKIRTAIGLAKRRLRFALDTELDTVDSLVGEAPEDIYDAIVETVDLACTIRTERTRILELDRTWGELIKNDPQEKQQLDDYKRRLGDYMKSLLPLDAHLSLLEKRYESLCNLHKTKVTTPEEYPKMRTNKTGTLLEKTVNNYIQNGITVAGRDFGYLGSSNSQMRDNGAYFMEKYSSSQCREYEAIHHVKPPIEEMPNRRKGYQRFRKIIFTPSSVYVAPKSYCSL
uniref:RNA-dependent RNA polymerase n=1 Tax=Caenorhabditis tropicalis TaxID=1561998 RepID=A0A1I7U5X7_9PELO